MDILVGILALALIVQSVRASQWKWTAKLRQIRIKSLHKENDALRSVIECGTAHIIDLRRRDDEWPDRIG